MKSRILVAVLGVPLLVYIVLWAPTIAMALALMVLAGIGAMELQQCVGGEKRGYMVYLGALHAAFTVRWCYIAPEGLPLFFMSAVVLFFGYAVFRGGAVKFSQLMAGLFGGLAIGCSFSAFHRIEALGVHRAYLLLPFILSFACDTFAFFAGLALGKHKLAPKVSPKKTVEGSIGGLAGNVACGELFVFVMDRFFGGSVIGYGYMVPLALACGVVAQLGDLSFSLIKREFGVKDYGRLFLEHGGVLDRFDSVLFVAPTLEIIFTFLL